MNTTRGNTMNITHVRKRNKSRGVAAFVTVAILALLAACGGGSSDSDSSGGTVRLGWLGFAGAAGWQIADDSGLFEEEGITLEKVDLRTPADLVPSLLSGQVDVGGLNPGNLSQALSQNLPLKIIGVTYYANEDMSILTMNDSGITAPKDLEGKKVGLIQLENSNHAALLETLSTQGVDVDTIEFVLIPAPEMPAALRSGQVDAGHVLYPLAATMSGETQVVVENMMAPYGEQPVQSYTITSEKFAAEHPDLIANLHTALAAANDVAQSDEAARAAAISELTTAPIELVNASKLPAFGNDLKLESSQAQLELMQKYGFLDEPVDLSEYVIAP